jgi:choline-phosphate cytidylyltransferase
MIKVITYGTFDLLHYGHVNLLKRAKALGDYLIVGVTADGFDRTRGKINVQQTLIERIEAVRATGFADEIIVEEYEGQKIDDICRYGVDIFTVGSDWEGKFDYLNEYCKVVYLPRTEGVSSSELRTEVRRIRLGLVGDSSFLNKVEEESHFVNGIETVGICTKNSSFLNNRVLKLSLVTDDYEELLKNVDAVFIKEEPQNHYDLVKKALSSGKHVLCEAPFALSEQEWEELKELSEGSKLVLLDGVKTAFSTAYSRLRLLIKSGLIGKIVSVDATCTSLRDDQQGRWDPIFEWGPTALLPVFQILGTKYVEKHVCAHFSDESMTHDLFTKIDFVYPNAVASIKVGNGVKSEGELIVSGTQGYIYVPAPWWNTEYFEIRYENPAENQRYFYQLDGEGIRFELLCFMQEINQRPVQPYIDSNVSKAICEEMGAFVRRESIRFI